MIAVDYRHSGRAIFPAQIEDVKTAIRWVKHIADAYRIDGKRLGLWGASSGGHLAALAALTGDDRFTGDDALYREHSSAVQAVVEGYGPIDFLQMDAHRPPPGTHSEDPDSLLLPRLDMRSEDPDSYESLLLGAPIATCPQRVREANPATYASGRRAAVPHHARPVRYHGRAAPERAPLRRAGRTWQRRDARARRGTRARLLQPQRSRRSRRTTDDHRPGRVHAAAHALWSRRRSLRPSRPSSGGRWTLFRRKLGGRMRRAIPAASPRADARHLCPNTCRFSLIASLCVVSGILLGGQAPPPGGAPATPPAAAAGRPGRARRRARRADCHGRRFQRRSRRWRG